MEQFTKNIALNATKFLHVFDVELNLPFKTARLGRLDFNEEGYFRSKRKKMHIHNKLNAWGVNAQIVDQHQFKWISIICDGKEFLTSKPFLIQFGKRLTFKNYETQYFLRLELWGLDLVKEFEKQEKMKPQQLSFFPVTAAA